MIQRLHNLYLTKVRTTLSEKFHYTNTHQVPRLEKIVINRGVGDASQNAKLLESLSGELTLLAGQAPVVKRAKKAIAGFQIRQRQRRRRSSRQACYQPPCHSWLHARGP